MDDDGMESGSRISEWSQIVRVQAASCQVHKADMREVVYGDEIIALVVVG